LPTDVPVSYTHLDVYKRQVRVTRDYRAVAQRFESDVWVWIWIGSHKDFDRQFPA